METLDDFNTATKTDPTSGTAVTASSNSTSHSTEVSDSDCNESCHADSGDSYHPSSYSASDTDIYWTDEETAPSGKKRKKSSFQKKQKTDQVPLKTTMCTPATVENCEGITATKKNGKRAKKGMPEKEQWTRASNKRCRMKGQAYTIKYKNKQGETVVKQQRARTQGPPCAAAFCRKSAKRQCNDISEEDRQELFNSFWEQMDWAQRKTYIAGLVHAHQPQKANCRKGSRRTTSLSYHLRIKTEVKQVCKLMFLNTFGLNEWAVRSWAKSQTHGVHTSPQPKPVTPTQEAKAELARSFIESVPKLPSHYCRQDTDKTFLEGIDSKAQLYRLFQAYCDEQSTRRVCRQVLFKTMRSMNVAIFKHRKDQCNVCLSYKYGNCTQEAYDEHIQRKQEAQEEKKLDKRLAEDDDQVLVVTVDLQQVLLAPKLFANASYFKTKLCCHNFTVYDLATRKVECYFWHEGQGDVSANNFTSCFVDYIKEQTSSRQLKTIIIYSDGCGYQNRNVTLANSLLLLAVETNVTIVQKFLEKGHTWMEADSVHSTIERRLTDRQIYWPPEYIEVITSARSSEPYHVKNLSFEFFLDFSKLSFYKSIRPGSRSGDPQVTDIRALKYDGSDCSIKYKLHHSHDWSCLPIRPNRSASRVVPKLYTGPRKIKASKFQHLQQLKVVMPREYHSFYDELTYD